MSELNFLDFTCPHCGETVSFPDEHAGRFEACPNCAESVRVPDDGSAAGQALPLPLATPRLALRRLHAGDWRDLIALHADEALYRFIEGAPLSEEEVLRWLEQERHARITTPDVPFHLGLQRAPDGPLIGTLQLVLAGPHRLTASVSLLVSPASQRQGYGAEALAAALAFCFRDLRLHRVSARCDSRDAAGRALCQRAGMRLEGEFVQDRLFDGQWVNTLYFAVLREEFAARSR